MNAVMIMCHKNISQVKRLILQMKSDNNNDVFVHIDSECKETDAVNDMLSELGNGVYIVDKEFSYHGILDDSSLVEIVISMIRLAKEVEITEDKHYQYYLLLSGQDYPIKSVHWISNQLKKCYPSPFIDCTPYDKTNWIYHKFNSNSSIRTANKWISSHLKRGILRHFLRKLLILSQKIINMVGLSDFNRLKKHGVSLYGGSAWWILPDQIINYILSQLNEDYVKLLLNSNTPEETFFQIMSMRSPLKDLVNLNPISQVSQSCKTWAYFSDEEKPFKGHPYIFTSDMFSRLIESEFWFARKFDVHVDEEILNMLDNYLQKNHILQEEQS